MEYLTTNLVQNQRIHVELIGTQVGYHLTFMNWIDKKQLIMSARQSRDTISGDCEVIFKYNPDTMIVTLLDDEAWQRWEGRFREMKIQQARQSIPQLQMPNIKPLRGN